MPRPKNIDLSTLEGWDKLEPSEQSTVEMKTDATRQRLKLERESRLAIGRDLSEIREILKPKGLWLAFLEVAFGWSERTAYRYIEGFDMASTNVPQPVLQIAIERGSRSIANKALIKKMPPPKTTDPKLIGEYLDELDKTKLPSIVDEPTLDERIKLCLHFVGNHYEKIHEKKQKTAFMRSLLGMELAKFGIASELSIAPIAIPEDYRIARGRPTKDKAA